MSNFAIITDTLSNLSKQMRDKYDIDYVKMSYSYDDNEFIGSLEWESHTVKEYYDLLREGKIVRSAQITAAAFEEKVDELCAKGYKEILYVACSSALSGSYSIGTITSKDYMEKHPEVKIVCVDARICSLGEGWLAIQASKLRDEGKSIDEVAKYLEDNRLKVHQVATVADLKYLKRAGRITASSAFFGNLLSVKPIIISDCNGDNIAIEKAKGMNNAKDRIAQLVNEISANEGMDWLYITHGDCIEDAEDLRDRILALRKFDEVVIEPLNNVQGASVGPGAIIAFCFGKEAAFEGSDK